MTKIPTQVQTAWVGGTTYALPPPLIHGSPVVSTPVEQGSNLRRCCFSNASDRFAVEVAADHGR